MTPDSCERAQGKDRRVTRESSFDRESVALSASSSFSSLQALVIKPNNNNTHISRSWVLPSGASAPPLYLAPQPHPQPPSDALGLPLPLGLTADGLRIEIAPRAGHL